ncbi:hypothetical protein [Methylobacterium ajmalii]|uniref:Alginate biosynthesis protein AlgF n=2 Tax=Methylobacterium TaxID=407 RepID=A0A1Y0ZJ04_9HYPH|nr:hypothetical protein Maq22A_2p42725 [Methylobacterium aquaticum]
MTHPLQPHRSAPPRGNLPGLRDALLAALLGLPVLVAGTPRAGAQVMLYEDRLPDGYAYVRFANASPDRLDLKPVGFADPMSLGTTGQERVSPYYIVEGVAGRRVEVKVEGAKPLEIELKPAGIHTVLIDKADGRLGTKVVLDQSELSQTKARLAFYNAMPSCAAAGLYLEPKGQPVLVDVGPNIMRGRSVNPAPNPRMRAACGTTRVAELDLGPLDAGGQYSVWLIAPGGTPNAFLSKNRIAPYLR